MATQHPRICKAHELCLPWGKLLQELEQLGTALNTNDVPAIKTILQKLVPGYKPIDGVLDWVHLEQERLLFVQ